MSTQVHESSEPSEPWWHGVTDRLCTLQELSNSLSNDLQNARSANDYLLDSCSQNRAAARLVSEPVLYERRDMIAETMAFAENLSFLLFCLRQEVYDMELEGEGEDQITKKLRNQFEEISDTMIQLSKNIKSLNLRSNAMLEKLLTG
ncbi:hypothetical protein B0J15DRAFT_472377 [Fusarium solani]|uniref:Uncharacterized protein n=1 Tax=Fusarium solani TaxID=169388 RepID=A0A9P9JUE1_FUSSL|nr:uncharacterized protein B0J15DRAFT_472377 [Fusarium solani]KAH7232545.1 hypothetical protein B0J15DRAFT_472377 [Fusarium solani]